jgi:hypothetical protein
MVVHACNPSYSGGRDQDNCGLRPAQAKSLRDTPISTNKPGVVACACHLSCLGSINEKIVLQAVLGFINSRPYSKKKKGKHKGLREWVKW